MATERISERFENLLQQSSTDPTALQFDLLIVGSGYGGAIAAASLAGARRPDGQPLRVALLERGDEFRAGQFPKHADEVPGQLRANVGGQVLGEKNGLFDLRINSHMNVVTANGLGGGSLINAGVMEEAKAAVFDQRWPADLQCRAGQAPLADDYRRARRLLGAEDSQGQPNIIARTGHHPQKLQRLEALSPAHARQAAITMALQAGPNQANVHQAACVQCGDCATGCNYNARNSLDTNLLLQARHQGAEIYTGVSVSRVGGQDGQWTVYAHPTHSKVRQGMRQPVALQAARVILAAGTLGSTEILLRSARAGLACSPRLGSGFSGNGDAILVAFGQQQPANALAWPDSAASERQIGPTITGILDRRDDPVQVLQSDRKTVKAVPLLAEEMAVPSILSRVFAELYTSSHTLYQLTEPCQPLAGGTLSDDPLSLNQDLLGRTSLYACMGDDDADGQLTLAPESEPEPDFAEGRLQVHWPAAKHKSLYTDQLEAFIQLNNAAPGNGGTVIANPSWLPLSGEVGKFLAVGRGPAITVHPLGGCAMADQAERGVVNQYGQLFASASGTAVYQTLAVLDGAILPSALGINPALTISALALRAAEHLARCWDWPAPAIAPLPGPPLALQPWRKLDPTRVDARQATLLEVNERLVGEVSLALTGRRETLVAELTLQFEPKDARDFIFTDGKNPQPRTAVINSANSYLRLFRPADWTQLTQVNASDPQFDEAALLRAGLTGSLEIMAREPRSLYRRSWTASWAWLCNRGIRDMLQEAKLGARLKGLSGRQQDTPPDIPRYLRNLFRLNSRAGEVRLFDYQLRLAAPQGPLAAHFQAGERIAGRKRITYTRRANPIRQLSEIFLEQFPRLQAGRLKPVLEFDNRYLVRADKPLVRIVAQQSLVQGFTDLLSFYAYFGRLILHSHFWTFRKPDGPEPRTANRFAQQVPGLPAPEVEELLVGLHASGLPAMIRLTRFAHKNSRQPPLLFIHGYSASSSTWAHPAVPDCAAHYFYSRGRDVWTLDLRTSAAFISAMLPWHFEDVAFHDIPLAIQTILAKTGARQIDVFAHCMGSAMLSMALLKAPEPGQPFFELRQKLPEVVRHVVLSQVAPRVSFFPQTMTRGYFMKQVSHLIRNLPYWFRPSDVPGMAEDLLDRLLQVLPYPEKEYDLEFFKWRANRWSATRRRMDALYGRTFNLDNMSDYLLKHIDDHFGPLSLGTLVQTIHFALQEQITNYEGENVYATPENFASRWSQFNSLTLHGADSGLADVATARLMQQAMAAIAPELRASNKVACHRIFAGMGHQDLLIGRRCKTVFAEADAFMAAPATYADRRASAPTPATGQPQLSLSEPGLGPVIGPRTGDQLPVMLGYNAAGAAPDFVLFARLDAQGQCPEFDLAAAGLAQQFVLRSSRDARHQWLNCQLPAGPGPGDQRWLAFMVQHPRWRNDALPGSLPAQANLLALPALRPLLAELLADLPALLKQAAARPDRARLHWRAPASQPLIALAACQYPGTSIDQTCAYDSYRRLGNRLEPGPQPAPDLLLLLGDQVYVDPSAGLLDPTDYHDRYVAPYHHWLGQPTVARVLRQLPSLMMPDDHEIANDWDQQAGSHNRYRYQGPGRRNYLLFQRHDRNLAQAACACGLCRQHQQGELMIYQADTRTERSGRRPDQAPAQEAIMPAQCLAHLISWLIEHRDAPKLVATASQLLPRRKLSASGTGAARLSDAWDGYPAQLHQLLQAVWTHDIRNLVFVSGDEHLSNLTRIELSHRGRRQVCHSVHSSGLNAPLPFVNSRPEDFVAHDSFTLGDSGIQCDVQAQFVAGDGFALLRLDPEQQTLTVAFDRRDGEQRFSASCQQ